MTRPIFEDSLQRTDRRLGYTSDQLLRRPAPTAGADLPWARISKGFDASNQTVGNNSFTDLTFNHDYNMGTGESGEGVFETSGTTALKVLETAIYLVTTEVLWFDAISGAWLMGPVCLNPTQDWNKLDSKGASTSTTMSGIVSTVIKLVANATVRTEVWQISGGTRNVDAYYLEIIRLAGYTGVDLADMDPDA